MPARHRIEVNVVDQSQKRPPLLDQKALVARLKYVPTLPMKGVKPDAESPLQPLHSVHQISLRVFERQVVGIAHYHQFPG